MRVDWKNRAYEKYNCQPQETFSCQTWNVWCICSSLSMSAPLKRYGQSIMQQLFSPGRAFLQHLSSRPQRVCRGCIFGGVGCDRLLPGYHPSDGRKDTGQKAMLGFASSHSVLMWNNYFLRKSSRDCNLKGFFLPSASPCTAEWHVAFKNIFSLQNHLGWAVW